MKKFGLLVFLTLSPALAHSATYYVATTGSDRNSCTKVQSQSTPKRTIRSGFTCLQPGDTLFIRAGTYDEGELVNPPGGNADNNRVTIAGYPSDGRLAVILRAVGQTRIVTCTNPSCSWITFDNLVFDAAGVTHNAVKFGGGSGAHHVNIINSEVKNATITGVGPSSFGKYINLHVHHNGQGSLDHGFYPGVEHDILIEGCDIHDNSGFGIHNYHEPNSGPPSNNVYINNRIHHNGLGLLMSRGNNLTAYNNLIYNNKNQGVQMYGGTNMQLYNNTIYGNGGDCIINGASNVTISNNICWRNGRDIINNDGSGLVTNTNVCNPRGSPSMACTNYDNPSFQNPGAGDFHLTSGSPQVVLTGGAVLNDIFTTDFAGLVRGSPWSLGTYAFGGTTVVLPAPTTSE